MTVSATQEARARILGSATLFEASGLPCAVDPALRPVWSGAFIAAPAYPVACSPGDNLALQIALERAPRGAALVVDARGFVAGYWGEVLTAAAEAAGLVGLVIDGGVRDTAAIAARKFPVFTRGISVRGTVKASAPSVGAPISLTGVAVAPGDWVVADDDGVVVIRADQLERTLAAGEARAEKEARMMQRLADGARMLDLLGLQRWRESP